VIACFGSEQVHHIQAKGRHMGYSMNMKGKTVSNKFVGVVNKLVAGWPGVIDLRVALEHGLLGVTSLMSP